MRSAMQRWAVGVLALGMGLGAGTARAGTNEWIGTPGESGDWFEAANWSAGHVPMAAYSSWSSVNVRIANGGQAVISGGEAVSGPIELAGQNGLLWNLWLSGGSLTLDPGRSLVMRDQGSLRVSGGVLRASSLQTGESEYCGNRVLQEGGVIELTSGLSLEGAPAVFNLFEPAPTEPGGPVASVAIQSAMYKLSGGRLSTGASAIGTRGGGVMWQTGGEHVVAGRLTIGGATPFPTVWDINDGPVIASAGEAGQAGESLAFEPYPVEFIPLQPIPFPSTPRASRGVYMLEGGSLEADSIFMDRTGSLDQGGGAIVTRFLSIGSGSEYRKTGGTLAVSTGIQLDGKMTLETPVAVTAGSGMFNFSRGTLTGADKLSLNLGQESLLILSPAQAATGFGSMASLGKVHIAGRDLTIETGEKVSNAWGRITDFVTVRGRLTAASGGAVDLTRGVRVEDGRVDLGDGAVTTTGSRSGITGVVAQLRAKSLTINGTVSGIAPAVIGGRVVEIWDPGLFIQSSGEVQISDTLRVGTAQYLLAGGVLKTSTTQVLGQTPEHKGKFIQTEGTHETQLLRIGGVYASIWPSVVTDSHPWLWPGVSTPVGAEPDTYVLVGGALRAGTIGVGWPHPQLIVDTYVDADGQIRHGLRFGTSQDASLVVQGGMVVADEVYVGTSYRSGTDEDYEHTLAMTSRHAGVMINKSISFGASAVFTAVPGATITITDGTSLNYTPDVIYYGDYSVNGSMDFYGSRPQTIAFENESTDARAMSGLENLRLVFAGLGTAANPTLFAYLEVAGVDLGDTAAGYEDNFALDTLVIGDGRAARVRLIDAFDNQLGSDLAEALYVEHLVLAAGSVLDLNGLNIYYKTLTLGAGAQILGGQPLMNIPEPGSVVVLMAVGLLALRRRRAKEIRA
ncbi:MAG: hypothetical protein IT442_03090 [Phycisphaeraceae bacterium]|nr:hypothetical protein [Phycisphaeraceae bacterium]